MEREERLLDDLYSRVPLALRGCSQRLLNEYRDKCRSLPSAEPGASRASSRLNIEEPSLDPFWEIFEIDFSIFRAISIFVLVFLYVLCSSLDYLIVKRGSFVEDLLQRSLNI